MTNLARDMINSSYIQVVSQYMNRINDKFTQYTRSMDQIAQNTIIRNNLIGDTDENNPYLKGYEVSLEVTKTLQLETDKELRNCMIYSNISSVPIYGRRVTTLKEASKEAWYLEEKLKKTGSFSYLSSDGKYRILSLVQSMIYVDHRNYISQEIGFLKLDINAARLFTPAVHETEGSYLYDVVVLDVQNQLVYSSDTQFNDIMEHISVEELSTVNMTPCEKRMVYKSEVDNYNYKVLFLFEGSQFRREVRQMVSSFLPVVLLIVIGVVFITYCFTRNFSKRIELLVKKINLAETGNLTVTEPVAGNDEIAELDREFSHMLKKLDSLIQKNYIQQLENKESELRNLQLQINPHFLYNTLETISSMAAIRQMFEICDICEKLGEIFRYSLGKNYGNYVTVEQELNHVQNYIFIQKARFGNKFEVFYNVEPEVLKKKILRFILQPIVENAIIHGLSPCSNNGTLEISIYREEDFLCVKVEDDGIGMPQDKVDELNEYINSPKPPNGDNRTKSIGVRNVNQRIKLSCGEKYGVTITSMPECGSCFVIKLPYLHKGED